MNLALPYTLPGMPAALLNIVLGKLSLKEALTLPRVCKGLKINCSNIDLWKKIATQYEVPVTLALTAERLKVLVRDKVEPVRFGRYFYLVNAQGNNPTLHIPRTMYMVPNGLATRALQTIPGNSVITQVSGLGVTRFFLKNVNANVQIGVLDEKSPNPNLKDAKDVTVLRDLLPPAESVVDVWKKISCKGLVINDWGVPFIVPETQKSSEIKSLCKKVLKQFPESAFIVLGDVCLYKNEKQKILKITMNQANKENLRPIFKNSVEIFFIPHTTGPKFIQPVRNKLDLI